MENLEEKSEFLYHEPINGDVYRYKVDHVTKENIYLLNYVGGIPSGNVDLFVRVPNKVFPDGSYYLDGVGSFFPETEEWKIKYQDSLSLRVMQSSVQVYFVMPVKRGKVNTRALVIDDYGATYHTFVPTSPTPQFGDCFTKLRMDLELVSMVPVKDLYDKVMEARKDI